MIIALTGKAGSGKSTVADYLAEQYGYTIVSLADPIKRALYTLNPGILTGMPIPVRPLRELVDSLGWDHAKRAYPEIRRLLQVFGTEVGREQWSASFWIEQARLVMDSQDYYFERAESTAMFVIPDVRFNNEAAAVTSNWHGKLWRIVRDDVETTRSHASENGVSDGYVTHTLYNDTCKQSLFDQVDALMRGRTQ